MAAERTAPVDHSVQYLTIIDMTVTYCSDGKSLAMIRRRA
jgi:hypothetical protein